MPETKELLQTLWKVEAFNAHESTTHIFLRASDADRCVSRLDDLGYSSIDIYYSTGLDSETGEVLFKVCTYEGTDHDPPL